MPPSIPASWRWRGGRPGRCSPTMPEGCPGGVPFRPAIGCHGVGAGIFAASGVGDLIWHLLFGIEAWMEALLSPTHVGLTLGVGLLVSGPWRAAWLRADGGQ